MEKETVYIKTKEFAEKFKKEKQKYLTTLSDCYNMDYDDVSRLFELFGSGIEREMKKIKKSGLSVNVYLFVVYRIV